MRRIAAWVVAGFSVIGCAKTNVCDTDPSGWYSINFKVSVRACTEADYERVLSDNILLTKEDSLVRSGGTLNSESFSADGCELSIRDGACYGGHGFCGELRWTEPGVYEGGLTYAHGQGDTGTLITRCVIHSEEAVLTLTDLPLPEQ